MRPLLAACVLFSIFACSGCGGSHSAGATPQATFDAMKSAAAKKDWGGLMVCFSPETLDMMIDHMSMKVLVNSTFGDKEKMKGANEILAKYGVKLDTSGAPSAETDPKDTLEKAAKGVKDKAACLTELMAWVDKNGDEQLKKSFDPSEMADAVLSDLKIEGDSASAKETSKVDGKDTMDDVYFKKIDGKWYLDAAKK